MEKMNILYLPDQYSQQRQREKPVWIYPVLMAMEATYYRNLGHNVDWDIQDLHTNYDKIITQPEKLDFLSLPYPSRLFTKALDKKYQSYGNYKYTPATHMMVANSCWWRGCTFCVEKYNKPYVVRSINHVMEEIENCHRLGIKEIFDDSGTFPIDSWLYDFCDEAKRMNTGITFGCNMRITKQDIDWELMKSAGFRMVLFGVESFNQKTLDKINKGVDINDIIPTIKAASDSGLEPHIAVMFGFPWETKEEENKTLEAVHFLLRKGYARTAQASYYDVEGMPIRRTGNIKRIYDVAAYPDFWINKLSRIQSIKDVRYLGKQIISGIKGGR